MVINAYVLAADPAYLEASISSYYAIVDTIVVSYDRSGLGWTGAPIRVDECLDRLRAIDPDKKMRLCAGDYARLGSSPMENDTYQRQCAVQQAGQGADWVLALDTDEILPNASEFARRLREEVPREFAAVEWPMRSFFRRIGPEKFLEVCTYFRNQISEYPGTVAVRSGVTLAQSRHAAVPRWRFDVRRHGRDPVGRLSYEVHGVIPKSEAILHFSWARPEADLIGKLESWSHNTDFDWRRYLDRVWKPAPRRWMWTYNFHPVWPRLWPALRPVHIASSLTQGPVATPASVGVSDNGH